MGDDENYSPITKNEHLKKCLDCGKMFNWLASKYCYHCSEEILVKKLIIKKQRIRKMNKIIISARQYNYLSENDLIDSNFLINVNISKENDLLMKSIEKLHKTIAEYSIDKVKRQEIEKKLREKLKDYESGHKGACPTCEVVGELNIKLEQKLAKAVEGLKFYADTGHWGINLPSEMTSIDPCDHSDFFHQEIGTTIRGGKRARQILKELGE